jgi:hypothetical protein
MYLVQYTWTDERAKPGERMAKVVRSDRGTAETVWSSNEDEVRPFPWLAFLKKDIREVIRMKRLNCWEVMKCGREPGGSNVHDLGICPASTEKRLNGIHGGTNAGRSCWVLAGTLCSGEVQGTFAQKYRNCESCDFYKRVKQEEFPRFQLAAVILSKLKG